MDKKKPTCARVRAVDNYGNLGAFDSSGDFSLDTLVPVVSNVTALQTIGTHNVAISYDLTDGAGSNVVMEISADGGATWTVPATSAVGDIGNSVSAGSGKTITWNGLLDGANQEITNARVRIRATDAFANTGANFSSSDFALDTKIPVGLANLSKFSSTDTSVTLNWTPATDMSFNHYELWYGANETDVQNRTVSSTAAKWSTANDANLSNVNTNATVITGITLAGNLYVKIWAVDNYGNEATIDDINVFTVPAAVIPAAVSITGGGGGIISQPIIPPVLAKPILTALATPTTNTKITISGLAEPRTRVDLYDNGVLIARLNSVADNNGQFSQDFIFEIGNHILTVQSVDFNNNSSVYSDQVNLFIASGVPAAPIILRPQNRERILEATPTITGTAAPATQVEVIATTAELPTPPTPPASLIRESTEAIELPGIATPVITAASAVSQNNNFAFSGTSLPNQDVIVYVHSDQALIYRTRTDSRGVWKVNHSQDITELSPGDHTIYAVTIDPVSKVKSRPSAVTMFTVKRNFWVMMYNYLNLRSTVITLGFLSFVILWLYRIRKKELALS